MKNIPIRWSWETHSQLFFLDRFLFPNFFVCLFIICLANLQISSIFECFSSFQERFVCEFGSVSSHLTARKTGGAEPPAEVIATCFSMYFSCIISRHYLFSTFSISKCVTTSFFHQLFLKSLQNRVDRKNSTFKKICKLIKESKSINCLFLVS